MEFNEKPAETGNEINGDFSDVEEFKNIIYKLVMHKGLNEEDRKIVDKIIEKKDEEVYGDKDKESENCNNL